MTVSQIKDHQSESVKKLIDWLNENKITEVECIFLILQDPLKEKYYQYKRFKINGRSKFKTADSVFGQTV